MHYLCFDCLNRNDKEWPTLNKSPLNPILIKSHKAWNLASCDGKCLLLIFGGRKLAWAQSYVLSEFSLSLFLLDYSNEFIRLILTFLWTILSVGWSVEHKFLIGRFRVPIGTLALKLEYKHIYIPFSKNDILYF